ncbi:MAG: hypothetical protein KBD31_04315 [Proteobacteria bacterium]|nr:hypothetical protein [Pseudomonadota bacterium]
MKLNATKLFSIAIATFATGKVLSAAETAHFNNARPSNTLADLTNTESQKVKTANWKRATRPQRIFRNNAPQTIVVLPYAGYPAREVLDRSSFGDTARTLALNTAEQYYAIPYAGYPVREELDTTSFGDTARALIMDTDSNVTTPTEQKTSLRFPEIENQTLLTEAYKAANK